MNPETLAPAIPDDVNDRTSEVLERIDRAGLTIATAESCTGGLLASLLTDVDGLGHCFERGIVSYSEESKHQLLGVPRELITSEGAVSRAVAIAMAKGALGRSEAGVAVAITGFAGRGGEDDEAGLVHFACASSDGRVTPLERHFGDIGRANVRLECLRSALDLIIDHLDAPAAA